MVKASPWHGASRLPQRRCGPLSPDQQSRIQALPLAELEALAVALLDFQGADDLTAWLAQAKHPT